MITNHAFAGTREDLSPDLLREIQVVPEGLKKARVYLSRSLLIKRSEYLGEADSSINKGDLEKTVIDKLRNEEVPRNARGQILEVVDDMLVVSFDKDCAARACAFQFQFRARDKARGKNQSEKFIFNSAPKISDFRSVEYRARSFWFGLPRTSEIIHLEVNFDEIHELIKEYKTHTGVSED